MTATEPTGVPTDDQLREYAAQLPDLYKDILAAIPLADPGRARGEGVYPESVLNTLFNVTHAAYRGVIEGRMAPDPRWNHQFSPAIDRLTERSFDIAINRLAEAGFLVDPADTAFGRVVPTPLGEKLIATITGRPTPQRDIPVLPRPTW